MKYRYNYSFLQKWMITNKKTANEILEVIGTKDYNTLRRWINGEKMIRTDVALRICNAYNIPITCFYVNMEETSNDIIVPLIERGDIIEPVTKPDDGKRVYEVKADILQKEKSKLPSRWAKLFTPNIKSSKTSKEIEPINDIEESKVLSIDEIRANFKQKEATLKKQLIDKDNIINNLSKALSNVTGLTKEPYKHIDDTGRDLVCEDLNK